MLFSRLLVAVALPLVLLPSWALAQSYGDGFGVGGVLLPCGMQTLLAKTRIGDALGLEAELALSTHSNDNASDSYFVLGAGALYHWDTDGQLQPYLGGRFDVTDSSSQYGREERSDTTFGLLAVLGAEYFVTRRLSVEGEAAVGFRVGSFSVDTGTRLAALLYL